MRFLPLLAIAVIGPTWAGEAPSPEAVEPEAKYQSAFADYRGWREEPIKSWREANEEMRRLSGHMGHPTGTAVPLTPPGKPPGAKDEPVPHAGHHHGGEQ